MKKSKILIVFILIAIFFGGGNIIATINIDPLSCNSLYLTIKNNEDMLGMATGFIVEKENVNYLVTNWHVLSGRHPETNKILNPKGLVPLEVLIWHHSKNLGTWILKAEKLYTDSGEKRWKEHKLGRKIDIVALPLENLPNDIQLYPFNLSLANTDIRVEIATPVSIIGFPLGLSAGGKFPIWKTGHIASEPDINYNGEPIFLIDATTRGGMSGSPVIFRSRGQYKDIKGNTIISAGTTTRFLGIYSGRLPRDSEIGRIWKSYLIEEILKPN